MSPIGKVNSRTPESEVVGKGRYGYGEDALITLRSSEGCWPPEH